MRPFLEAPVPPNPRAEAMRDHPLLVLLVLLALLVGWCCLS